MSNDVSPTSHLAEAISLQLIMSLDVVSEEWNKNGTRTGVRPPST